MAKSFKQAAKEIEKIYEKVVQGTALQLFSDIVLSTPVGNPSLWKHSENVPAGYTGGRLRANWQVALGAPANAEIRDIDPSGGGTVGRINSVLKRVNKNTRAIYLTNNLPYADRVEKGWSKQAPSGMVRVNAKRFKSIVANTARRNKK